MIRINLPNIITIALCGMLGYGALVAVKKTVSLVGAG